MLEFIKTQKVKSESKTEKLADLVYDALNKIDEFYEPFHLTVHKINNNNIEVCLDGKLLLINIIEHGKENK